MVFTTSDGKVVGYQRDKLVKFRRLRNPIEMNADFDYWFVACIIPLHRSTLMAVTHRKFMHLERFAGHGHWVPVINKMQSRL